MEGDTASKEWRMADVLALMGCSGRFTVADAGPDGYLRAYAGRLEESRGRVVSLATQLRVTYPDLSEEITRGFALAERVYGALCEELGVDIEWRDDNLRSLLEQLIDDIRAVCEGAEILIARTSR
jgi:hypothetical protein